MTFSPNASPPGWADVLSLLEKVTAPATIWLFDDHDEGVALSALLQESGQQFSRDTFPRWYVWRKGEIHLYQLLQSHRSTIQDFPEPTHALWLQAPSLDLRHYWYLFERRLNNRPVAAATTHWRRLQLVLAITPKPFTQELVLRLGLAAGVPAPLSGNNSWTHLSNLNETID